jgi:hypothetical protein
LVSVTDSYDRNLGFLDRSHLVVHKEIIRNIVLYFYFHLLRSYRYKFEVLSAVNVRVMVHLNLTRCSLTGTNVSKKPAASVFRVDEIRRAMESRA